MSITTISSVSVLKREIDKFNHILSVPETEDTWESLLKGIQTFSITCKNGACDWPEELIPALRLLARPLVSAMSSERTRLSGVAIDFIASVASGLGSTFEPLLQVFLPVLLTLSGRTNKVIITRARACIIVVIETTQLASILPYLLQSIKDKSTSLRLTAAEGTLACMNCFNPPDLEQGPRAREIEAVIRATARDANADVRKVSRKIFEAYKLLLPDRVDSFTGPLTPTMKKYLDIKSLNIQSQSTIVSLTSNLEARSTLSASTSAIPSIQRPAQKSQSQAQLFRSASSSAISTDECPEKIIKPVRRGPEKSDMLPPQYVPIRSTQPNHMVSVSRSASVADSRKLAVYTLSRSTTEQVGLPKTAKPSATSAYPARPASASSLLDPQHRPGSNLIPQLDSQISVLSGPRRVPLPEVPKKAALARTRSKSQSTFKPAGNDSASARKLDGVRPTDRRKDHGFIMRPNIRSAVTTTVPVERISKVRGVTQPTLAQLARTRPTLERKVPTAVVLKPLWGGRPASQAAGKKVVPVQNSIRRVPGSLAAPPRSPPEGRSKTPIQIPLPPSPSPSITRAIPNSRSTTPSDNPSPVPLFAPTKLPSKEGDDDEDIDGGQTGRDISNDTPSNVEVVAPTTSEYSRDCILGDENLVVDGMVAQTNIKGSATPQGLLTPQGYLEPASNKTPISALLSSIQRGFLYTPSSPLSPPHSYLPHGPAPDQMKDLTIPFPLHIDRVNSSDGTNIQAKTKFMFGVMSSDEASRHMPGGVENLNTL